jgi:hypothetical protein
MKTGSNGRKKISTDPLRTRQREREGAGHGFAGPIPEPADQEPTSLVMGARMRVTTEQLTKSLAAQGIRADFAKQAIKADMARSRLQR